VIAEAKNWIRETNHLSYNCLDDMSVEDVSISIINEDIDSKSMFGKLRSFSGIFNTNPRHNGSTDYELI
jgi:hypothetical protein